MSESSFSLVIPIYRNEDTIDPLLETLRQLSVKLDGRLEVIFVVDGSPDRSYARLRQGLTDSLFPAQLICLARNFGSFAAVRYGLQVAGGPFFAVTAADLQEPSELMLRFFQVLSDGDVDVVLGRRTGRDDAAGARWSAQFFWWVYRRFVQRDMPRGGVDVFGVNRAARDALLMMREANTSLVGQLVWIGMRRVEIPYVRRRRMAGKSSWTLRKRVRYMADSVFSFTDLPIVLVGVVGGVGLLATLIVSAVVVTAYILGLIQTPGYTPLILAIMFSTFVILLALGMIGSYVWRTFENSKQRPHIVPMLHESFERGQKP